jgi:hypothetical protein
MAVIHDSTMLPRTHVALVAEKVKPVVTVNHAARQRGHFGNSTSKAPGKSDPVILDSFRARSCDLDSAAQH